MGTLARLLAAASFALIVVGCTSFQPSDAPRPTERTVPTAVPTPTLAPTPMPSQPAWFGEALLVAGSTGTFSDPAERVHALPAWLVVWRDGLVSIDFEIASDPPNYRSIEVDQADLGALEVMLRDSDLVDYVHDPDSDDFICADCNDVVIQCDAEGRFVEVIVPAIGEEMGYPPGVNTLTDYVALLWAKAARSSVPWSGTMPTVLAAPTVGG